MPRPGLTSKYQRLKNRNTSKIVKNYWFSPNITYFLLAFEQTNFYETMNFISMFTLKLLVLYKNCVFITKHRNPAYLGLVCQRINLQTINLYFKTWGIVLHTTLLILLLLSVTIPVPLWWFGSSLLLSEKATV